ncbi:thiol reductant ABC exporter subunit CydD [Pseudonocardia sp. TRM90224]|uniref:thiol reductant ABC exporter subunit CydD n=1 Tax=Pseudonocardia sp. TRM90224 TaxID=2812678 RepID=UPI001E4AE491|nr:thiol reductant ABC exporter subunit CydD [Pseudonocardia sp. TRM90224]
MRPLDPRLVRTARSVRVHLAVTTLCGVALTGLVLAQAWLIARVVAGATAGETVGAAVAALGFVVLARVGLAYGAETAALRSAVTVKSELRRKLVTHVTRPGADPTSTDAGGVATLATSGLDALDDYIARYLPQLVLAVVTPVAVLAVVGTADWLSALVIGLTLPLVPLFMALVGWHTQARTQRQWRLLERLGGHFLDVVEGLPTLALFRRAKAEAALIRSVTEEHRSATMGTLRVAFLSAFVLELLSTLAVAVVAVEVGLRLLYGGLSLETALLVLILAPEAYLPLREVGARFHASQEGVAATSRVLDLLDEAPPEPPGHGPAPAPRRVRFVDVSLTYPGARTALQGVDLAVPEGRTLLVTGRSGAGKSSLLALLLRFVAPTTGTIVLDTDQGSLDLAETDPDSWRRRIAWVPQQPYLFDASAADNIRLGEPDASDAQVRRAAELAEAHELISALPQGYGTPLGERGTRLSAGQRQRIALARAFLRAETGGADLVLLDEPTAHLDAYNAALVRAAVARLVRGRTAVVVAHDEGWADLADDVVELAGGRERVSA